MRLAIFLIILFDNVYALALVQIDHEAVELVHNLTVLGQIGLDAPLLRF